MDPSDISLVITSDPLNSPISQYLESIAVLNEVSTNFTAFINNQILDLDVASLTKLSQCSLSLLNAEP